MGSFDNLRLIVYKIFYLRLFCARCMANRTAVVQGLSDLFPLAAEQIFEKFELVGWTTLWSWSVVTL